MRSVTTSCEDAMASGSGADGVSISCDTPATSLVELREISGHTTVVALIGEHDLRSVHRLRAELERARLAATVIVDLTHCTFLELTIIASLLSARGRMRVELALPPAGSIVDRTLQITGLPELFTTHRSLEEALNQTHRSKASL